MNTVLNNILTQPVVGSAALLCMQLITCLACLIVNYSASHLPCTSIPLDLHHIRPEACIWASLGKLAAATCEHMIVDGRTRYPYYPLHGRPAGEAYNAYYARPGAAFSQQVSHEASTRRPSACCLVRRPHACHRIGHGRRRDKDPSTCHLR